MTDQPLIMPKVGESITEGTILSWLKQDGETVEVDEPVVEVETEKVNVEIPSPWAGKLRIRVPEGEKVKVEEPLGYIETMEDSGGPADSQSRARARTPSLPGPASRAGRGRGGAANMAVEQSAGTAADSANQQGSQSTRYSPAVLSLAREHDVDLTQLSGSGLLGRITRKDVVAHLVARAAAPLVVAAGTLPQAKAEAPSMRAGEIMPLTPMRRTIAERMARSAASIPHVWLMMEADVSGLVRLRQQVKEEFREREGVDLTYLPFVIKAVVEGLKDHPILNSSWSDEGIALKKELNIGLAVATEQGLIVPVVHHADDLSIGGLARKVDDLAGRARARKLRIEDVEGGTFTVDNTGAFGSVISVPLINYPQAAIMTFEAIVQRPVVVNDAIAIRHIVNLCMSFDHRILDGAQAGAFLSSVKGRLEEFGPETLLF